MTSYFIFNSQKIFHGALFAKRSSHYSSEVVSSKSRSVSVWDARRENYSVTLVSLSSSSSSSLSRALHETLNPNSVHEFSLLLGSARAPLDSCVCECVGVCFGEARCTMDRDYGSKPGSGGAASAQNEAIDRRERLRRLALETIDLAKDPYFMRNHLGR